MEMSNAAEAITNLMASLENYYDAARNAMLVKKAVRKFGQTQSIVALIGQEGLAAAQSFSMEGFWGKVKEFLIKIWEKIKEWWGRFWGLFFSVESKLSSFVSSLNGKRLAHDVEFDAPDHRNLAKVDKNVRTAVANIKQALADPKDSNMQSKISQLVAQFNDTTQHGGVTDASGLVLVGSMHYKLSDVPAVKAIAEDMLKIVKDYKDLKKDIDEYTKKALDQVKNMKITQYPSGNPGDAFGRKKVTSNRVDDDATTEEQDVATKVLKQAAKLNNQCVAACVKHATAIAVKLMAHTRLVD